MFVIAEKIAADLSVKVSQVEAAIKLLEEGNTVPFIARYRKEKTGGLTDNHLRNLEEKLLYLKSLEERKTVILKSIDERGLLTPSLKEAIVKAESKNLLEDLYLPYKQKRKNKADMAKAAGLLPLAMQLLKESQDKKYPILAASFLNPAKDINSTNSAIEGAKHILLEHFSQDAAILAKLRDYVWENASLSAEKIEGASDKKQQYKDYYEYSEALKKIPSHRALALFRGRREGILLVKLTLPGGHEAPFDMLSQHFLTGESSSFIEKLLNQAWSIKILSKLELELMAKLKELAEDEAISVFANNLKDLLLFPPAGTKRVLGIDPGIRTGIKVAALDETGKLLDYVTLFPFAPQNNWHEAVAELAKLIIKYDLNLVGIGNGTGGRETERLIDDLLKTYKDLTLSRATVNEAGASIYSASVLAEQELPDVDVSLRGAVSIARRLQDPLAELVKIEPKSIGVGQYQHDVNQVKLSRTLGHVVEDCVNAIGVDVNTASSELLQYVAGLNQTVAKNLVAYRNEHGLFKDREDLKAIERLGDATFKQCAGFLKINGGNNPLDKTSIHPESYELVENIAKSKSLSTDKLLDNKDLLQSLNANDFVDDAFGLPTIKDVLFALKKPGRDPRGTFKTATFKENVESIADLEMDMILEGVVTNVANFGAFVDIGVHQDALVHISELTNRFISSPRDIVKTGDVVTVKVIEVDKDRKRIGLSMKQVNDKNNQTESPKPAAKKAHKKPNKPKSAGKKPIKVAKAAKPAAPFNTAMADALLKLKEK